MDLVGVIADLLDGLLDDAELVLIVGAGEVAEDLDAALKEEAELVKVQLVAAVDVDRVEDLAKLGLVTGLCRDRVDAEDAAEVLVRRQSAAEFVQGDGSALVVVAPIEDLLDLSLVVVVPLWGAHAEGGHGALVLTGVFNAG